MAYTLEAFVAGPAAADVLAAGLGSRPVPLGQGLLLVPLPKPADDDRVEASSFGRDLWWLTAQAEEVAVRAAAEGQAVVYVEAEYFGGFGEQHAVLWRDGAAELSASELPGAIDAALAALGVRRVPSPETGEPQDEFDSVDLGRHRHTADWVTGARTA